MPEPTDRLADLLRQRTLVREQLAWLDREIAATQAASGNPVSLPAPPATPATTPVPPPSAFDSSPLYSPDAAAAHADGRRGCFLYAAAAFALLFAVLAAIYFLRYRDRSLIFVERPARAAPAAVQPSPSPRK